MTRNRVAIIVVLAALALLPYQFSQAGGWASVEIVDPPDSFEAGQPVTLSVVIKGHGIEPVDVDPLVISATNDATGETVEVTAVKADGEGNYTVELTLPSEGVWVLQGTPGGYPPFDMGPLRVGQSLGGASLSAPGGALIIDISGGMGGGDFEPGSTEITAGTLVVWTNNSVEGHTIVIDGETQSSGLIAPGAAYAMLFDEPGTYRYECGPHPSMSGEIAVV